jgi:lipoprotein-anchoring transpeptidase ErfK/SrfK
MKKLISLNLVCPLKVFLLGAALTLGTLNTSSNEVLAQSRNQRISQQIQSLKQSDRRWIQVNISNQRLVAWEGRNPVYAVRVSTGKKKTPTLAGIFNIQSKLLKTRMRGDGYDMPNVPNVMYYSGSYGIHGVYWHNSFGTPVSRGCVNVAPNHAKWLYNWASVGTPVIVQK